MDAFIGEVRVFPYNYEPEGWLPCDGRSLAVSQHQALHAVIENTYGGIVGKTFNLPDLRGRVLIGLMSGVQAPGPVLSKVQPGQKGGTNSVALTLSNFPAHGHEIKVASANGNADTPSGAMVASGNAVAPASLKRFAIPDGKSSVDMASEMIGTTGTDSPTPHDNNQPTLGLGYFICVDGEFPVRS